MINLIKFIESNNILLYILMTIIAFYCCLLFFKYNENYNTLTALNFSDIFIAIIISSAWPIAIIVGIIYIILYILMLISQFFKKYLFRDIKPIKFKNEKEEKIK